MSEKKAIGEKNVKKRNWAFVLYPESSPEDWKDQLQKKGIQCVVSPLHDKDVDPDGEIKKPHYHIILAYSGPTSWNVVKGITDSLKQPIPQPLEQLRGYYRYLTHKDNPDKFQYNEADILRINGFNISDFIELSKSEITAIKMAIVKLIRSESIKEYSKLMDHLMDQELIDQWEVASNNTLFFDRYITSSRFSSKRENQPAREDTITKCASIVEEYGENQPAREDTITKCASIVEEYGVDMTPVEYKGARWHEGDEAIAI